MNTQSQIAEQIARRAHAPQFRRDGVTPYITHPERVARRLAAESDEVRAVAWLHDVIEDTDMATFELREAGVSQAIVGAVELLTKRKGVTYEDYLIRIRSNEIARKVKIADMLDNLSDAPSPKQILKYAEGLKLLQEEPQVCLQCRSKGWPVSITGVGCTFCDGTEGGNPPKTYVQLEEARCKELKERRATVKKLNTMLAAHRAENLRLRKVVGAIEKAAKAVAQGAPAPL